MKNRKIRKKLERKLQRQLRRERRELATMEVYEAQLKREAKENGE